MADILLHAAIKENDRLKELSSDGSGTSLSTFATAIPPSETPGVGGGGGVSDTNPQFVVDWQKHLTPLAKPRANGFKVCEPSYFRCGADCNWCVPAGVSKVLFQVWAPGGGTSTNCCCGGSPFGPSGAFYMTEINVAQGECYCLRAGCAYCCYAYQTTPGGNSEDSCIRSCSNDKICLRVESGQSCYRCWNADAVNAFGWTQWDVDALPSSNGQCSAYMCSGWNFCWDGAQDASCIPHIFSSRTWCEQVSAGTKNFGYGIPAIWPWMCIGQDANSGNTKSISPPVFGFETCVCSEIWNGNTCSGCQRGSGPTGSSNIQQFPSAGGYAAQVYSGCNACGGDAGGMGMICVAYACD
jgi:hypothetical protein